MRGKGFHNNEKEGVVYIGILESKPADSEKGLKSQPNRKTAHQGKIGFEKGTTRKQVLTNQNRARGRRLT